MRAYTITDCEIVEVESDDLLLRRLQKSVAKAERQKWMRQANDLLLASGVIDGLAEARDAYEEGLSPSEFVARFLLGGAA